MICCERTQQVLPLHNHITCTASPNTASVSSSALRQHRRFVSVSSAFRQRFVSVSSALRQRRCFVSISSAFRQLFVSRRRFVSVRQRFVSDVASSAFCQRFVSASSALRQRFVSASSASLLRQRFVSASSAFRQQRCFVSISSAFRQRFVSASSAFPQRFVSVVASSAFRQRFVSVSSASSELRQRFVSVASSSAFPQPWNPPCQSPSRIVSPRPAPAREIAATRLFKTLQRAGPTPGPPTFPTTLSGAGGSGARLVRAPPAFSPRPAPAREIASTRPSKSWADARPSDLPDHSFRRWGKRGPTKGSPAHTAPTRVSGCTQRTTAGAAGGLNPIHIPGESGMNHN